MRDKIVLFTTRPVTSKFSKSLVKQMAILKEFEDKYDFVYLSATKTPRAKEYVESISGLKISEFIPYRTQYLSDVVKTRQYNTWIEYVNDPKSRILTRDDIAHVVVFGSILSSAAGLNRQKNNLGRYIYTKQQMAFLSNGIPLAGQLQLAKYCIDNDITYHECAFDPCENSLAQTDLIPPKSHVYFGYDTKYHKRLDSLQAYLASVPKPTEKKKYDLCFGFTVLTHGIREEIYARTMKSVESLGLNTKIFVKHKYLGIDTFVDQDTYLSEIARSRFTIMIPPYDYEFFSPYRFIESVHNNCLPLLMSDIVVDEFKDSYKIPQRIIDELSCDYDHLGEKIKDFSETRRLELLDELSKYVLPIKKRLQIH